MKTNLITFNFSVKKKNKWLYWGKKKHGWVLFDETDPFTNSVLVRESWAPLKWNSEEPTNSFSFSLSRHTIHSFDPPPPPPPPPFTSSIELLLSLVNGWVLLLLLHLISLFPPSSILHILCPRRCRWLILSVDLHPEPFFLFSLIFCCRRCSVCDYLGICCFFPGNWTFELLLLCLCWVMAILELYDYPLLEFKLIV